MPHSLIHRHTLYDLIHHTAVRYPHKTAVIEGKTRWTYLEWDIAVQNTAHFLARHDLQKGSKIAVYARNSAQYATLIFAAAHLGAVLVPINFMLSPQEIAYILTHCQADSVISDSNLTLPLDAARTYMPSASAASWQHRRFVTSVPPISPDVPEGWTLLPLTLNPAEIPYHQQIMGPDNEDLAQILYTSGTESRPKGAMLSHSNLIAEYVSVIVDGGFSPDDVVLHALPFYHSAQQHVFLGPYTYLGATHVIISAPRPDAILSTIAEERVTEFFAPPTVWISLLRSPLFDQSDLSSLVKGHYGASIMPKEILQELSRRLPRTQFWNFYG